MADVHPCVQQGRMIGCHVQFNCRPDVPVHPRPIQPSLRVPGRTICAVAWPRAQHDMFTQVVRQHHGQRIAGMIPHRVLVQRLHPEMVTELVVPHEHDGGTVHQFAVIRLGIQ